MDTQSNTVDPGSQVTPAAESVEEVEAAPPLALDITLSEDGVKMVDELGDVDLSLADMAALSGKFAAEICGLSVSLTSELERIKQLSVSKRDRCNSAITRMGGFASRQAAWFAILLGRASMQPAPPSKSGAKTVNPDKAERLPKKKKKGKTAKKGKSETGRDVLCPVPEAQKGGKSTEEGTTEAKSADAGEAKGPETSGADQKGVEEAKSAKAGKAETPLKEGKSSDKGSKKPPKKGKKTPKQATVEKGDNNPEHGQQTAEPKAPETGDDGFVVVTSKSSRKREKQRKKAKAAASAARLIGMNAEGTCAQGCEQKSQGGAGQASAGAGTADAPIRLRKFPPQGHVLIIRSVDPSITYSQIRTQVSSLVNPVHSGIKLRSVQSTATGGMRITADTVEDLAKLEKGLEGLDSTKFETSKPGGRKPEIVIFGIESDLSSEEILAGLRSQNEDLKESSLELLKRFDGNRGANAIVSVDEDSYKKLSGKRKLNVGWCALDFRPNTKPLQCYKCWKFGHNKKVCRSKPRCGSCGAADHERAGCKSTPKCPSCATLNARGRKVPLPTNHMAGSRHCPVYNREVERLKTTYHADST